MKTDVIGLFCNMALLIISLRADAHKVGDLAWCYMPTTLHLECIYHDEASCESARKTISEFMKHNGRSYKNAPDESGAKAIDPVCKRNPDKVDRGGDVFGRVRSDKGAD